MKTLNRTALAALSLAITGAQAQLLPPGTKGTLDVEYSYTSSGRESTPNDQYEGGADEFRGTGHVCDLTQPFRVSGSGVTVSFTPTSDRAGSYSYEGSMSGFGVQGKGRYSVDYNGDLPTQIRAYGPGSVSTPNGTVAGEGDERYTLTPAPEGNCD
jgi:hypothetical protein